MLLERGATVEHPNYPTATKDPWDFPHRLHLSPAEKKEHFIQSRHYSFREDNKHFYINDKENPYEETKRFDWIRGDIVGGRSLLWARACYRWSDLDFEANLKMVMVLTGRYVIKILPPGTTMWNPLLV